MTQEEKELLLKDICARTLYRVMLKIGEYSDYKLIGIVITDEHPIKVQITENGTPYKIEVSLDIIKPYLRPMSSMTEEERHEYGLVLCDELSINQYDWLNAHHFDYRGLIERDLALEAPEDMYKERQ